LVHAAQLAFIVAGVLNVSDHHTSMYNHHPPLHQTHHPVDSAHHPPPPQYTISCHLQTHKPFASLNHPFFVVSIEAKEDIH